MRKYILLSSFLFGIFLSSSLVQAQCTSGTSKGDSCSYSIFNGTFTNPDSGESLKTDDLLNLLKTVDNKFGYLFWEASGTDIKLRLDNPVDNVIMANTNTKVGIGVSPSAKLHIKGDDAVANTESLRITDSLSAPLIVVENDGQVGIGTADPSFKLELDGSAAADWKIGINGTQTIYLPDQTADSFGGSFVLGNGGGSLTHATTTSEGQNNTLIGIGTASALTTGESNTFIGANVAPAVTTGLKNTLVGAAVATALTTGIRNVIVGNEAGISITISGQNTLIGDQAGDSLSGTTGSEGSVNTFIGSKAGANVTVGEYNIALGKDALYSSGEVTTGDYNIGIGQTTGGNLTSGTKNILIGDATGSSITTGANNVVLGNNSADITLTTGSRNILIGDDISTPASGTTEFLSIGNLIFAIDGFGTGTTAGIGKVGIGTAAPTFKLELVGTTTEAERKMGINSVQTMYLPDQTAFTGSLILGDGGTALLNTAGTDGQYNTFVGIGVGAATTTGQDNTAIGSTALTTNTIGDYNTAVGKSALTLNLDGDWNTAVGGNALPVNSTGDWNTAVGYGALEKSTGNDNTAIGYKAGWTVTTGSYNTAIGEIALNNGSYSTGITGDGNIGLGYKAGDGVTTGSRNIAIGYDIGFQAATTDDQLTIGNLIFADGGFGTGTTVGLGLVGIGDKAPDARLKLKGPTDYAVTLCTVTTSNVNSKGFADLSLCTPAQINELVAGQQIKINNESFTISDIDIVLPKTDTDSPYDFYIKLSTIVTASGPYSLLINSNIFHARTSENSRGLSVKASGRTQVLDLTASYPTQVITADANGVLTSGAIYLCQKEQIVCYQDTAGTVANPVSHLDTTPIPTNGYTSPNTTTCVDNYSPSVSLLVPVHVYDFVYKQETATDTAADFAGDSRCKEIGV